MSLFQKIKNLAAGLTLLGAVTATDACKAEDYKPTSTDQTVVSKTEEPSIWHYAQVPQRTFNLPLVSNFNSADPRNSFEANTDWYTTVNESFGKASDQIGTQLELDKSDLGRLMISLSHAYLSLATRYASHEVAHNLLSRKKFRDSLEFEFGNPGKGEEITLFFKNTHNTHRRAFIDLDDTIFSFVSGLNQQEHNMENLYEKFAKEDVVFFNQGIDFILNKLHQIKYAIEAEDGSDYESIMQLRYDNIGKNMLKDPTAYTAGLKEKGIKISKNELIAQNIIPAALSLQTYHSLLTACNYFVNGRRTTKPIWLDAGKMQITPPLFSNYLTTNGSFWNADLFIKTEGFPLIEAELGLDVNFLGESNLDRFRTGVKLHDIPIIPKAKQLSPKLSPYTFVNFARSSGKPKGFLIGADLEFPLKANDDYALSLTTRMEVSKDDVKENTVKGENDDFNLSFGLKMRF